MNSKIRSRQGAVAFAAVIMLAAACMVPLISGESEGASVSNYDVYLPKGTTWNTNYSYTASLSPSASVLVSTSQITSSSTGWSAATTNSTSVSSGTDNSTSVYATASLNTTGHAVNVTMKVGLSYSAGTTVYVGVKLTTVNPSQSAITVFKIHILAPSFTTGYAGGSFYSGETVSAQTPAVTLGNGNTYKTVTYSIGTGSNTKTLAENTGLSFNTSTGAVSGTVSKTTNSSVTYTVTATMTTQSGYPASITATTSLVLGTYSSASMSNQTAYAIKNTDNVSVAAPTTSGITYALQSSSYTLNGGSSTSITAGTAFNGLTVSSTGALSGKPTTSGVYVITENFRVTETGQTTSRTITVTVEDKVVVSAISNVSKYVGNSAVNTEIATGSHTETNSVSGTWSLTDSSGKFQINSSTGKITVKVAPTAGEYTLTVKYTSSASSTNYDSKTFKVFVDPALVLSCSDGDKTLYAATSSAALDNGQDEATMSQTATLYAGSKTVSYAIASSTLTVGTDVSISSAGVVTINDTLSDSKIGTHTVTVTCTDNAVTANKATMDLTVVVVAAMTTGAPSVGTITSS